MSMPYGQFIFIAIGYQIHGMDTVFETRRNRLAMLVKQHGSVVAINRALGWDSTNARLYQIHNRSIRADRDTPYEMGDVTAREIEQLLKLPVGWMDTPPSYIEFDPDPLLAHLMEVARSLKEQNRNDDLAHLVQIGDTFVEQQPKAANGR